MHINNNTQQNHIYQTQNTISNASNNSSAFSQGKTVTDTVSISNAEFSAKASWQEIANNYDVTNISQNEMAGMVTSLTDNKLISSTEGLYLMAPRSINLDPEVKFDVLATMHKALAFAKEHGGSVEGIKNQESAVEILKNIQALFRKT